MTAVVIPTRTDAARYTVEVDLDQQTFRFDFDWNDRQGSWSFDLYDATGALLLAGRKVTIRFPLINRFRDSRFPPGELSAVDTSDSGLDPAFADLGDRVKLLYTPVADLDPSVTVSV